MLLLLRRARAAVFVLGHAHRSRSVVRGCRRGRLEPGELAASFIFFNRDDDLLLLAARRLLLRSSELPLVDLNVGLVDLVGGARFLGGRDVTSFISSSKK